MFSQESKINRTIFSVSGLTDKIKSLLETTYPFVWITGEISNFSVPLSGHFYFTLKDENAQIHAVMFRGQNRQLKFDPTDGMQIIGLGRIGVYKPRGTYQIIFELLEPKGVGALQVAFEQLKAKLANEGMFNQDSKKPLPFLPRKIALITSPTGAAVQDIIKVLTRRFPGIQIRVVPVKVQGDQSPAEIVDAIGLVNKEGHSDIAILARGGGSLEDLQAFNDESVARAVWASSVPIVSAVGHETDVTITDFVADLRAPTPSAAAEMVVPLKYDLVRQLDYLSNRLVMNVHGVVASLRQRLDMLTQRLVDPQKKTQDFRIHLDDLTGRLVRLMYKCIEYNRNQLDWRFARLHANIPLLQITKLKEKIKQNRVNLLLSYKINLSKKRHRFNETMAKLDALSPMGILSRGYSITRAVPKMDIVRAVDQVKIGQHLSILLEKGTLLVNVIDKTKPNDP